jgi:putative transposase
MYGKVRVQMREIIHDLARQISVEIIEGHLMSDHVHVCMRIPPKLSVSKVIRFLKGKSAVRIHRGLGNKRVTGLHFWARGYCVSTVGLDEETIRQYIRDQEKIETQQQTLDFE